MNRFDAEGAALAADSSLAVEALERPSKLLEGHVAGRRIARRIPQSHADVVALARR